MDSEFKFLNQSMPRLTIIVGSLLILEGIMFYFITGMTSFTALIPSFFGLPLAIVGYMAQIQPEKNHFWMHIAVSFGLLTFLGGGMAIKGVIDSDFSASTMAQLIMLTVGGIYTYSCVQSFIHTRKSRDSQSA
ncbi:MAG: hypothetical protein CMB08_03580 [Euryarchaeota archaeon]|nr:hypothetical protein [Euryarchaeota archaeon]